VQGLQGALRLFDKRQIASHKVHNRQDEEDDGKRNREADLDAVLALTRNSVCSSTSEKRIHLKNEIKRIINGQLDEADSSEIFL
jgi:hypothetical protein